MSLLHVSPSSCPFTPQKPLILWTYPQNSLLILILILFCLVLFLTPLSFSNTRLHSVSVCVCVWLCICVHAPLNFVSDRGRKACPVPPPAGSSTVYEYRTGWGGVRTSEITRIQRASHPSAGIPQPSLTIGQEGRSVQAAELGQAVTRDRTELHRRHAWDSRKREHLCK